MITVKATKNSLSVSNTELMTSGSVNINFVQFEFNEDWAGLAKTAIFQTKKVSVPIGLSDDNLTIPVPWEVLAVAGEKISVGVYGTNIERADDIVLPTIWGSLGSVTQGVVVANPPTPYPTPDTYLQLIKMIEDFIVGGGTGIYHDKLSNRDIPDQHPMTAITGLSDHLDDVNDAIVQINKVVGDSGTSLGTLSGRVDTMEGDITELDKRLTEVANKVPPPEDPIPAADITAIVKEVMDSEVRRSRRTGFSFRY